MEEITVTSCIDHSDHEWLSAYSDGLGEFATEADRYNDKRLGATLDAVFVSDRHELLTKLSARAIALHEVETNIMHNDTTTVTFTGAYERDQAEGSEVKLAHGYNKDHRPDYKQIVFGQIGRASCRERVCMLV